MINPNNITMKALMEIESAYFAKKELEAPIPIDPLEDGDYTLEEIIRYMEGVAIYETAKKQYDEEYNRLSSKIHEFLKWMDVIVPPVYVSWGVRIMIQDAFLYINDGGWDISYDPSEPTEDDLFAEMNSNYMRDV